MKAVWPRKILHISEPLFPHHFPQISSYWKRNTKSYSKITDTNAGKMQHDWVYTTDTLLFSRSVVSNSLRPHGLQFARLPCPTPSPRACSSSCPLSQWYHPTILPSVTSFSCFQSFPASESFLMSQFFTSSSQNIGASASASVFPMYIQDLFHLGLTGWIFLQSKGLSRVFSNTTVHKHQFFSTQLSL